MEKKTLPGEELVGKHAYLPDGQLVIVEIVYADGQASVRRVGGERKGTEAVCSIAVLRPESA